jgi:hypothetical protein
MSTQRVIATSLETVLQDDYSPEPLNNQVQGVIATSFETVVQDEYEPEALSSDILGYTSALSEVVWEDQTLLPESTGALGYTTGTSEFTWSEDQISGIMKFSSSAFEIVWTDIRSGGPPIKSYTGDALYPSSLTGKNLFRKQFTGYSSSED